MKLSKITIFVFVFLMTLSGFSQDLIYKINGEVVECEVLSIDKQFVNYTKNKYTGKKVFSLEKTKVKKIVYESSEVDSTLVYNHSQELNLEKELSLQNKNTFKMGVFSPLAGALSIGYERSLRPTRSFEMFLGFIGAGSEVNENAVGGYARLGYKLYRKPTYYQINGDDAHLLHGFFVMPTLMVSYFTYDELLSNSSNLNGDKLNTEAFSAAFILNIGKQWIFNDEFSLQFNIGAGYAVSSDEGYYYSHLTYGNDFPLALSCGLSFGFLN